MKRSEALKYVVAKRVELGYNDLPCEMVMDIYELLAEFDNSKENLDKFVEYHF